MNKKFNGNLFRLFRREWGWGDDILNMQKQADGVYLYTISGYNKQDDETYEQDLLIFETVEHFLYYLGNSKMFANEHIGMSFADYNETFVSNLNSMGKGLGTIADTVNNGGAYSLRGLFAEYWVVVIDGAIVIELAD